MRKNRKLHAGSMRKIKNKKMRANNGKYIFEMNKSMQLYYARKTLSNFLINARSMQVFNSKSNF